MSYILDALRRLEKDKEAAQKGINPMEALLARDPQGRRKPGVAWVSWIVIASLVLITIVASTYFITRKMLLPPAERPPPMAEEALPGMSSDEPVQKARQRLRGEQRTAASNENRLPFTPKTEAMTGLEKMPKVIDRAPPPSLPKAEVYRPWQGEEIKLSAIAYSKEPKNRFAVANLRTVREGDMVAGLRISEIQEDGIVIIQDGDKYKIFLGKR